MAMAAERWLAAEGMTVKSEFVTPWGICDLVGLRFNRRNVDRRRDLKQTRAIGSITRAVLLMQIPDKETQKSTTLGRLVRQCAPSIPEEVVSEETHRLIADHFVKRSSRGRLQKMNGWMPLQDRLVAVELKLSRIAEAMRQAMNNLGFAEESYVGLPSDVADRVAANASRWSDFFDAGVGLLSVTPEGCKVVVKAQRSRHGADEPIRFYCVEKFWRTRVKGNGASATWLRPRVSGQSP